MNFEPSISATSLPEAYHEALCLLHYCGEVVPCPDYNTTQKELSMTFMVTEPLNEPMISRLSFCDPRSLEQYRQEILYGILDFEIERGKWAYTYHSRIEDQIPFVVEELKRNPYTRRAVIDVRDNDYDVCSENPACLQHIQYFIRGGKLHCKVLFRSNDACKATFMNAFALIMLQQMIAGEVGVEMGSYTHRANSFHCYERDFDLLEGYVNRIRKDNKNTTYCYEGDWKERMEEEQPEIEAMVESLRGAE